MAFPTTPVLDTFVRANENPLDNGTWESFPHWFGNNLVRILSNSAQATGADNGAVWKTVFGQDQEAYVTITEVNGLAWFAINIRGTVFNDGSYQNDSYDVGVDVGGHPGEILCENQSPDWGTWGSSVTQAVSNGDSIGIRAIGSALEAWYKPSGGSWTQIRTGTNSSNVQSGQISLAFGYSGTSPKFNDFGGGTYVPPSLTCTTASFTLTGNAASLIPSNRILAASQASFTLTGQAVTLNYSGANHTMTASPASFAMTGNAAGLGRNAVIVDPSTSYQTFKGWEATAQAGQEYLLPAETPEYPSTSYVNYKAALIEAMIDLGLNRLRIEARLEDVNTTGYDPDNGASAVQPTTAASGDWHYEHMTRAMDSIGTPLRDALAARGESLYISICIVDFDAGGYDAENDPNEYAFFINKFITEFYNVYGFLPDAIEAILEPGSGANTTNWTAAKVANNIVAAQALLASSGPSGAGSIKFIAPSLEAGSLTETWMDDMTTANSAWETYTDQISYHRYSAPDNTTLASFRDLANAFGAYPAMTEKIGANVDDLYNDLISGHGVAWQQFTIAFPYTGWTDNGAEYFEVNTSTWAVTPNTRTKYLRQYFKYIRRGAVMKGVTNRSSTLLGVPFVNTNGAYVVPVKCTASGTFDVLGLPAGTYGIRYTTGNGSSAPSAYDTALTTQTISAGGAVNVVMPAAGVVTIFDGDYRPPMPAPVRTYALTGNAATLTYSGSGSTPVPVFLNQYRQRRA